MLKKRFIGKLNGVCIDFFYKFGVLNNYVKTDIMKRFFIAVLMLGFASTMFAQNWTELFAYELEKGEYRTYYKIDREGKYFSFDADGDQLNPIKNYKKVGNKETFDVYLDYQPNTLGYKVEITLAPELENTKIKTVEDLKKQQIKVRRPGTDFVETYGIKLKSQGGNYPYHDDEPAGPGGQINKVKDGAKQLFNKGKEMMQKNKEKREAKKEEKAKEEKK